MMNIKAATLLSLVFSTLIIFSCSSLGHQEPPAAAEPDLLPDKPGTVMSGGWKHETEITHEGSRSEGSISRLFYRYTEIPGVFTRIIIGRDLFEYKAMVNIWDNSGYIPASLAEEPAAEKDLISSAELKRGWYESSGRLLKKTTPPEWVFVETKDLSLWVSPEKICDMIKIYNFNQISQNHLPEPANE